MARLGFKIPQFKPITLQAQSSGSLEPWRVVALADYEVAGKA